MDLSSITIDTIEYPIHTVHTLIIGSGAAALKAADRLHQFGMSDIAVVTDNVEGGTSLNTGSDKQTYYKVSLGTEQPDSPYAMAESIFIGGSTHGDMALTEALGSLESFYHLVNIGVPFPHNKYGGYVGYKTDHDPAQRGTSIGPFTSKVMVEKLFAEVRRRGIPLFDRHEVVSLLFDEERVYGALAVNNSEMESGTFGITVFLAENVIFGTGGPGGLYANSVYPEEHIGGIGLALEAGAEAFNLEESQYGMASVQHRWNVSGSYQQVVPRYISTDAGGGDEREFLSSAFPSVERLCTAIFLKGYQWPFDVSRIDGYGSSLIDVIVHRETVEKGRRVFLDFTRNPLGFSIEKLEKPVYRYLEKSGALAELPIDRLRLMNGAAIDHYRQHGIDLLREPLEIAVCAQHNNGGLGVDIWWESTNLSHLFPVGEVAGTHGVKRPGGSALNSGQVGAARAALRIAHAYKEKSYSCDHARSIAAARIRSIAGLLHTLREGGNAGPTPREYRKEIQRRMTAAAGHIRNRADVEAAIQAAREQSNRFKGCRAVSAEELRISLRNRHLALAQSAYLEAIRFYLEQGGGSRGSCLVTGPDDRDARLPEKEELRESVLVTRKSGNAEFSSRLESCRPIPKEEYWFEQVWREYQNGDIFRKEKK